VRVVGEWEGSKQQQGPIESGEEKTHMKANCVGDCGCAIDQQGERP
jgi:hypothetical protein